MIINLENTALSILEGEEVESVSDDHAMALIEHLHAWLPNYPKGTNKFITYLHTKLSPLYAIYGLYSAIDNGSLEITSRNLQTMMFFEKDLGYLVKYLENPDKKANFFAAMRAGTDLSLVELELASPFILQPEEEIGTGTYEQKVAIEDLFADTEEEDDTTSTAAPGVTTTTKSSTNKISMPSKRKLRGAVDKVLGKKKFKGDMTEEERDEYYVYTQFLYRKQIISPNLGVTQYRIVSEKFLEEFDDQDEFPIEQYLVDIIPNWDTEWKELSPGLIEYSGTEDSDTILKSSGFFKERITKNTLTADIMYSVTDKNIRSVLHDALGRLSEEDLKEVVKGMKDEE